IQRRSCQQARSAHRGWPGGTRQAVASGALQVMSRARSAVVVRDLPRTAGRGRGFQVGLLGGLAAALLAVMLLAVTVGQQPIPPPTVAAMLLQWLPVHPPRIWSEVDWIIVTQIRLPRVITGVFVGGALSVAGAAFQALFRNPLADP